MSATAASQGSTALFSSSPSGAVAMMKLSTWPMYFASCGAISPLNASQASRTRSGGDRAVRATDVHARVVLVEREHARMFEKHRRRLFAPRPRARAHSSSGCRCPPPQSKRARDRRSCRAAARSPRVHHPRERHSRRLLARCSVSSASARAAASLCAAMTRPSFSSQSIACACDQFADSRFGFFAQLPQIAGVVRAEPGFELGLVLAVAGVDLAAVAPGRREADGFGLEQDDLRAGLREMQRGGEPGVAATDHADIGRDACREARPLGRRIGRWRRSSLGAVGSSLPSRGHSAASRPS